MSIEPHYTSSCLQIMENIKTLVNVLGNIHKDNSRSERLILALKFEDIKN